MEYVIGTKVFGDWVIVRKIGAGANGEVFEIQKTDFNVVAKSALKVIHVPHSEADIKAAISEGMDAKSVTSYFKDFVQEIVNEIALMAEIKGHPGVVSYEDHKIIAHEGDIGWDILIRMELLTPLVDYQLKHKFDEAKVLRMGRELCSALAFCQRKGMIHRDIKPENIFVSETGQFKLGDFGVARTIEKTTGGLSKKGTESYMAPEVYLGRRYGASVDIYSLGLVLYKFLNKNRLPFFPAPPKPIGFTDRENALASRMRGEKLPAPSDGSEEFAKVVLKACAYDPKERYHTADEMLAALRGVHVEESSQETPPEMGVAAENEEEDTVGMDFGGEPDTGEEDTVGMDFGGEPYTGEEDTVGMDFGGEPDTGEEDTVGMDFGGEPYTGEEDTVGMDFGGGAHTGEEKAGMDSGGAHTSEEKKRSGGSGTGSTAGTDSGQGSTTGTGSGRGSTSTPRRTAGGGNRGTGSNTAFPGNNLKTLFISGGIILAVVVCLIFLGIRERELKIERAKAGSAPTTAAYGQSGGDQSGDNSESTGYQETETDGSLTLGQMAESMQAESTWAQETDAADFTVGQTGVKRLPEGIASPTDKDLEMMSAWENVITELTSDLNNNAMAIDYYSMPLDELGEFLSYEGVEFTGCPVEFSNGSGEYVDYPVTTTYSTPGNSENTMLSVKFCDPDTEETIAYFKLIETVVENERLGGSRNREIEWGIYDEISYAELSYDEMEEWLDTHGAALQNIWDCILPWNLGWALPGSRIGGDADESLSSLGITKEMRQWVLSAKGSGDSAGWTDDYGDSWGVEYSGDQKFTICGHGRDGYVYNTGEQLSLGHYYCDSKEPDSKTRLGSIKVKISNIDAGSDAR